MNCKIQFIKYTSAEIIIGEAKTRRDFDIKVYDLKEVAYFLKMLIDNNRKFETSFELASFVPKLFIYFYELTSDNIIKEFNSLCEFLKKEVFDPINITFLEINAGILQETYKKY